MEILLYILIASFLVSLFSFSGSILFVLKESKVNKYLIIFVALAAGSFLATSFFHLIPESIGLYEDANPHIAEELGTHDHSEIFWPSYFVLFGILFFYIIEKFVHWHHHHEIDCHKHSLSTLSLVGDGFHNFIDGILIAVAFLVDIRLGIITAFSIALHEIPQEIGDLAILLHSGFSKYKALFWNFMSALLSLFGSIFAYIYFAKVQTALPLLIAFTAGCFIYIALADIIPELKHRKSDFSQVAVTGFFFIGILMVFILTQFL